MIRSDATLLHSSHYLYIGGGHRSEPNGTNGPNEAQIREELLTFLRAAKLNHNYGLIHAVATSNQPQAIKVMRELGFYESEEQISLHHISAYAGDKSEAEYGPGGFHYVLFFMPIEEWEE